MDGIVSDLIPHNNGIQEGIKNDNMPGEVEEEPVGDPPVFIAHGQCWFDAGKVTIYHDISHRHPRLLWPGNPHPLRSMLDYFKLMYPMILNQTMLEHTNAMLPSLRNAPTTVKELFKCLGLRLNMTLDRTFANIPDF